MKLQWRSINLEQEERFTAFRERKTQIEKDVSRTDRTHPFFAGDDNKNIDLLQDILMTYVMYNFDLGYVQVSFSLSSIILHCDRSLINGLIVLYIYFSGNVRFTCSYSLCDAK